MRWYPTKLNPNTPRHDAMYQILYFINNIFCHIVIPNFANAYKTDFESTQIRKLNIAR